MAVYVITFFTVLILCCCSEQRSAYSTISTKNEHHLRQFFINASSLSITAMAFSPMNGTPPPWLRDIFGDRAVFWYGVGLSRWKNQSDYSNQVKARANFQVHAQHQPDAAELNATCSLEFLAFSRIEKSSTAKPFTNTMRNTGPAVGRGAVHFPSSSSMSAWRCYYRAVYSNWRVFDQPGKSYWTTLVYCPVPENNADTCDQFMALYSTGGDVPLVVDVYEWEGGVRRAEVMSYHDVLGTMGSVDSDEKDGSEVERAPFAICTAWPFTTSVPEKVSALKAMIYEYIRYYSMLGVEMFIYDMRGLSMDGVFESDYAKANAHGSRNDSSWVRRFVRHHPYTMMSLLHPEQADPRYDFHTKGLFHKHNTNMLQMDSDKTLTLSHCRYEARTKYGIEHVLVIDFDEFLYCPGGGTDAVKQRTYVRDFINQQVQQQKQEITFYQTIMSSKAVNSTILDCVLREVGYASKVVNGSTGRALVLGNDSITSEGEEWEKVLDDNDLLKPIGSIFNCISGINYLKAASNVKSMHLQHTCPLTNYHHACGPIHALGGGEASYDCNCEVKISDVNQCALEHFMMADWDRGRVYELSSYMDSLTELYYLVND